MPYRHTQILDVALKPLSYYVFACTPISTAKFNIVSVVTVTLTETKTNSVNVA